MPYEWLADWFELLNDDCGYPQWSQYFIERLAGFHAGKEGLELGCGSGYFSRALTKAGYRMEGADISLPMLQKASSLAASEGCNINFFRADAAALKTPKKYDFILSPNDCFNYLPPEALPRAFRGVLRSLKAGGVFFFDISAPCKLREKVANTISADDRDDVTYLSFNTLNGNRVEMDVTLFVKEGDGRFSRHDEKHILYIHEEEAVRAALEGFDVLVEGHLGEEKEGSPRLNFLCRKRA